MSINPANAHESIRTAGETGVDILVGRLCFASNIADSQPSDPHFHELLDHRCDEETILPTAPVCPADPAIEACGTCDLNFFRRREARRRPRDRSCTFPRDRSFEWRAAARCGRHCGGDLI